MIIEYIAVKDEFENAYGDPYISYGIEVRENGRVIRRVPDITLNKEDAKNFAELCNKLELDPIQLDDAIYDLLCRM